MLNFSVQNDCLLLKHLDNFFNHADQPWVHLVWKNYYQSDLPPAKITDCSFCWRDCLKLLGKFKSLVVYSLEQGRSILLWEDKWTTQRLMDLFPRLSSFAIDTSALVKNAFDSASLLDLFHLPLSEEAFQELYDFVTLVEGHYSQDAEDV